MAAYGEDGHVAEFLDKHFGDNIHLLKDVYQIFQEQEELAKNLEQRIQICKENTDTKIKKSNENGNEMLKNIDHLNDEKSIVKENGDNYFAAQKDLTFKLQCMNEQIEEINCLQVYLSWISQIHHLSKELRTEIEKGSLSIAVEFFMNLSEITERLKNSSCTNLVDYAISTNSHWMKVLSDVLSKNVMALLNEMKWPFPTGISSPALNDNSQDILSQFETFALLLLKLHYKRNEEDDLKKDAENLTQLTTVLVTPLKKRFAFHFYGPRKTNNIEKPEWYFTQILNWIRDHSEFLENYVQPLVEKAGIKNCVIQQEFISALISTCIEKIKCSLQQISSRESLFSHLVDEVLSFDEEIRSSYNYPFSGCSSTLIAKPYLEQWLHIEKKSAVEMIDNVMAEDASFHSKSSDMKDLIDNKVPSCVQYFILHLSLITERHRNLDDTETQLQFVELQIYLLEMFIKRLKEKAKEAVVSANHEIFYSLINGCHYMIETLNEWTEQVFFIQLHCARLQLSSKPTMAFTRIEDSFHEENVNTSIESTNSDYLVDKTLFDEVIANLESFVTALIESLVKTIEGNLTPYVMRYSSTTWHSLPSSKDIVTPILSNSACQMLMFIKESLHNCQNELCHPMFTKLWQNLARNIDSIIFHRVILENHFNEGGSMQLKFDLMKNLFVLFNGYTQKPDSYFKLIKESCSLLTLLPGCAVLLNDLLKSAEKSGKQEKQTEAVNALLDIGIKNISMSISFRILSSRIDLPKI